MGSCSSPPTGRSCSRQSVAERSYLNLHAEDRIFTAEVVPLDGRKGWVGHPALAVQDVGVTVFSGGKRQVELPIAAVADALHGDPLPAGEGAGQFHPLGGGLEQDKPVAVGDGGGFQETVFTIRTATANRPRRQPKGLARLARTMSQRWPPSFFATAGKGTGRHLPQAVVPGPATPRSGYRTPDRSGSSRRTGRFSPRSISLSMYMLAK